MTIAQLLSAVIKGSAVPGTYTIDGITFEVINQNTLAVDGFILRRPSTRVDAAQPEPEQS